MKRFYQNILLLTFAALATTAMFGQKNATPAIFPEGDFEEWVQQHIIFPELARIDQISGVYIGECYINEEGMLYKVETVQTPHHSITDEVRRVCYTSPAWTPAILKKKSVDYVYKIEIDFNSLLTPEELEKFAQVSSVEHPLLIVGKRWRGSYGLRDWMYGHYRNISIDDITDDMPRGEVVVNFGVSAEGETIDLSISTDAPEEVRALVADYMNNASQWAEPALIDGEPHSYHYSMPITWIEIAEGEYILNQVDIKNGTMPAFNGGGLLSFRNWFSSKMVYPDNLARDGSSGRVVLTFVVERDGSIGDVEVVEATHKEFADAAVKTVQSSPKWVPGYNDDGPMRIKYTLPISFGPNSSSANTSSKVPPLDRNAGPQRN